LNPKACGGGDPPACVADCDGKVCGDDGCEGSCGECAQGQACTEGACVAACTPNCGGNTCGDDGCGGSCGACAQGQTCEAGQCVTETEDPCEGYTVQGCCDGQTVIWCEGDAVWEFDCAPDGGCGWDAATGAYDCGTDGEADPSGLNPKACGGGDPPACVADCDGKVCGDDGCEGSCGECAQGQACTEGACVAACTPNCDGKACGDDGCEGSCGTCAAGLACDGSACVAVCTPNCGGNTCGDDGCEGSCGDCAQGQTCEAGQCQDPPGDPCEGYSFEGCCDGQTVIWCEDDEVLDFDCNPEGGCGWDAETDAYDCSTDGQPDPSGQNPMACP
ncbi:MAG: hypothetical protein QF464_04230, partial [Myxococcota bacterium]|nr:hypothetical protein [Myxococcota bacterium]